MKAIPNSKLPGGGAEARSRARIDPLAAAPVEVLCADLAAPVNLIVKDPSRKLGKASGPSEAMVSSCGDGEGCVSHAACPSQLPRAGCAETVHELSNLVTAVLLTAQMLEWKLPPYSHLKRPIREIARNAQRAGELFIRLTDRCTEAGPCTPSPAKVIPRDTCRDGGPAHGAAIDLTADCDPCTSGVFPKRDD